MWKYDSDYVKLDSSRHRRWWNFGHIYLFCYLFGKVANFFANQKWAFSNKQLRTSDLALEIKVQFLKYIQNLKGQHVITFCCHYTVHCKLSGLWTAVAIVTVSLALEQVTLLLTEHTVFNWFQYFHYIDERRQRLLIVKMSNSTDKENSNQYKLLVCRQGETSPDSIKKIAPFGDVFYKPSETTS